MVEAYDTSTAGLDVTNDHRNDGQLLEGEALVRRQLTGLLEKKNWELIMANLKELKAQITDHEWLAAKLANNGMYEVVALNFPKEIVEKVIPDYEKF